MRLIGWTLVVVLLLGAFVATAKAAYSWWQVSSIVDEAALSQIHASVGARAAGASVSAERRGRLDKIRDIIVRNAEGLGLALTHDRVGVAEDETGIRVRVRWVYPLLEWEDEVVVAVPLSIDRSFAPRR